MLVCVSLQSPKSSQGEDLLEYSEVFPLATKLGDSNKINPTYTPNIHTHTLTLEYFNLKCLIVLMSVCVLVHVSTYESQKRILESLELGNRWLWVPDLEAGN